MSSSQRPDQSAVPDTCRAALATKDGVVIEEVPVPSELHGGAIVRVEAAAICGSDWGHLNDERFFDRGRVILGHENIGRVVAVDEGSPLGVRPGDRLVVEEFVPCGRCAACRGGRFHVCPDTDWRQPGSLRYGRTPIDVWPGLWGGFAELMYVHPSAGVHRLPEGLPAVTASLATPVANGLRWLHDVARLQPGERVLVVGPGAHGLGCVLAARAAGAGEIAVVGTDRDGGRLADARRLGADVIVTVHADEPLAAAVRDQLGGPVNVAIDLTPAATDVVDAAVDLAASGGRILLAGHKHGAAVAITADRVLGQELQVLGVRGCTRWSMAAGLDVLARHAEHVSTINVCELPLEDTWTGLRVVGRVQGPDASRVIVTPQALGRFITRDNA